MKDRLQEFHQLYHDHHDTLADYDGDEEYFLQLEEIIQRRTFPPRTEDFLRKVTSLQHRLVLVQKLITDLRKKYVEILTASGLQQEELADERDQLMQTIKETSSYIHTDIKQLEKAAANDKPFESRFNIEDKIKRDQLNVLLLSFQDTMLEYNNAQMQHREQCTMKIRRQLEISGTDKTMEEIESMVETGSICGFQSQLLDDTECARHAMRQVEERHLDILKLEQSITDLHEVFQDLNILVEMQGNMLDNIARNVEETASTVQSSNRQMKQALKYKKRTLLTLCFPCVAMYRCCTIL